jgi:hypothetical protein
VYTELPIVIASVNGGNGGYSEVNMKMAQRKCFEDEHISNLESVLLCSVLYHLEGYFHIVRKSRRKGRVWEVETGLIRIPRNF